MRHLEILSHCFQGVRNIAFKETGADVRELLVACTLLLSFAIAAAAGADSPGPTRPASPIGSHTMGPGSYPWLSVVLGEQGNTDLGFTINPDGTVANVHVVKSSGSSRLDAAAVEGAKLWRYNPAMQNGNAVAVPWQTRVVWKLTRDPADLRAAGFAVLEPKRDEFPPGAVKSGEEGITFIGLRLAPSGQIIESEIYRSSGHDDLDAAAMRLALERTNAKPGTVDGKTVMTMIPVAVIWSSEAAK